MTSKSFVDFPDYEGSSETTYETPDYIRFKEGMPVIVRILDDKAHHFHQHWINRIRSSVICLGDDCPICERNAKLRRENPNSYRNMSEYLWRQNRYRVNVLDRTPVIKDPETGDEYYAVNGTYPTVTRDGDRSLVGVEPEPSNTVKLLEKGKQVFEQLKVYHQEKLEVAVEDGEETVEGGITTFDVKFMTIGKGPRMNVNVLPEYDRNDDVTPILEENDLQRWELSEQGIHLTPEEMMEAVNGVQLRDIFAARRATEDSEVESDNQQSLADASEHIEDLWD